MILIATGAHPRVLPDAVPDGERILTWTQVYALDELPEKLIVVGSGVTGAEFASALRRAGRRGRAGLLARPGAAGRGRRRGPGAGGRLLAPRSDRAVEVPGRVGDPGRRPGDRPAQRRPRDRRLALPAGGRVDPEHRRHGSGRGRRHPRPGRLHHRRQGVADLGPRRLRGRRLHRGADAGLGGRHAGPDRDVARPRRRGRSAGSQDRVQQRLHRPGDRHRGDEPGAGRRGRAEGRHRQAGRCRATPGPRCRVCARASSRCSACR